MNKSVLFCLDVFTLHIDILYTMALQQCTTNSDNYYSTSLFVGFDSNGRSNQNVLLFKFHYAIILFTKSRRYQPLKS